MGKSILVSLVAAALVACGSNGDTENATSSGGGGTANNGGASATAGSATGGGGAANGGGGAANGGGGAGGGTATTIVVGGSRPATVYIPPSYKKGTPTPLLMMLHGYSATSTVEELYLQLEPQSEKEGFIYVHPDGTTDAMGEPFWNATDACCNFDGSTVDDDGYLTGVLDEIATKLTVDPKRVYVMGHSNGGFMTYRMACNHADKIAAIAVLAGEMVEDVTECKPSAPVSLLHIQGTADMTIAYAGGSVALGAPPFPGAVTSVGDWVGFDKCGKTSDTQSGALDIERTLAGAETDVTKFKGCASGAAVELWTINGGGHIPTFQPAFAPDMTSWLLAKKKH